jgi:NAD(P)-dependent dehydrogenase (short-subunit alcohol dehydrogenase family)
VQGTAAVQGRGGAFRFPRAQFCARAFAPSRLQRWAVEQTALVTGGSSGIGLAIAHVLREQGFRLTLAARTREKLDAAAEVLGAHAVVADVTRDVDCRRLVDEHRERWGRLDVLVNSAGVGIAGSIDELDTKHIDLQLNVNLRGLMLVTAAALPLLREAGGLIVNLASIAGTVPSPRLPVYGAAKAAVIQFTDTINHAEEEHGVRATALSPGFVDTPMTDFGPVPKEQMIRPEDCAEIVRALLRLSPRARLPHVVIERIS